MNDHPYGSAFEDLFEHSLDGVMLTRPDGTILRANRSACRLLERTEDEICRLGRQGLMKHDPGVTALLAKRAQDQRVVGQVNFLLPEQRTVLVEFTSGVLPGSEGGPLAYVIFHDGRPLRDAEERLRRGNRALLMVTQCTEALVRASSETELYRAVCDVIVKTGGYRMVWIGMAEHDAEKTVRPVAWAGHVEDYLATARITWADSPRGQGPTGTAVRQRHPVVGWVFESDERLRPWREAAQARGYRCSTALPLFFGEGPAGVITMYSSELETFDPPEYQLLARLAENLAWAVDGLRHREARAQAEERVRHSEAMLRGLADTVPDPLFLKDRDSRWVFVNAAALEVVNKTEQAALGRTDRELYADPAVGEALMANDRRVMASGQLATFEESIQAREGQRVYEAIKAPFRDAQGQIVGIVGIARDVSVRHREEADRRRLATAIEQAAEMVLVTDAKGAIEYVNPAFERITGYARAEAMGKNPRLLKSGLQDEAFYRDFWATISSGQTWQGRLINRRKDGQLFTEEASISPVRDAQGGITAYVAVKRDITRDLALEQQLRQSQKMEGIGRLAGGVAHDFNNILSVIMSFSEVVLNELKVGDPLREDVGEIDKAAQRAAALTRQLLAFSRQQVLQPVRLDLNRVLANLEKMLRRIVGEDVQVQVTLDPALGTVRADPGQIDQVLMNLVVNARDAMAGGGRLSLETRHVEIDAQAAAARPGLRAGDWVVVSLTDSGHGMDEHTRAHLFEPFFTTKEPGKGTGLGLSTVYGIVQQSDGYLTVDSVPGRGSTFSVYLPRTASLEPDEPQASSPSSLTRRGGHETVLLVEDDEAVRNLARRLLAAAGYTVLSAANGGEALLLSEQATGTVHLVLTDVVMPLLNGRAMVDRLRRARPGLKALYMSGHSDDAIIQHGVLEPGIRFLAKPFTPGVLLAKVREALDES